MSVTLSYLECHFSCFKLLKIHYLGNMGRIS